MSKTAFLFPGQGAQSVGMGQALYDLPAVRQLFDRAAERLGYDLAEVCFQGPAEKLNSTEHSQPALFVVSLAAVESLRQQHPDVVEKCSAVAGLSLGEYSALVFAGVLSFDDGLDIVRQRGAAMQEAAAARESGMVSIVGMEASALESLCDEVREEGEYLQIANLLCPGNIVVSGDLAACRRIEEKSVAAGAMKAIPLTVAGAFHTPIMDSAVAKLQAALAEISFQSPRIPVISNVDAQPHDDPEQIRDLLVQQVVSPVQWEASMRYLIDQGWDGFYEVGPGKVLRGLLRRIARKLPCENVAC